MIAIASSMEGGHLLGQGSYGCAFTPPLLCKKSKSIKKDKVGKITITKDANHEIAIANLLRQMPLVKNYILLPDPELCEPAPIQNQKDREIKDCEAVMRQNEYQIQWSEAKQIFLPFGGRNPLGNMIMDSNIHPKYFNFLKFMTHILEAGSLLLISGVCHFDLHPNNFLQDQYGVVRILDLGQAFNARHIDNEILDTRWKMLVFGFEETAPNPMVTNAEPPEITVINAMRNGYEIDAGINNVIVGKAIFGDMEKYLDMPKIKSLNELTAFFKSSESIQQEDWLQFWKLYWTGFDSWAIGCLLLTILQYQLSWTEFLQGEWQSKKSIVLMTLRSLLHPNPRKRLDCAEALFMLDPQNAWINRFGKSWLHQRQELRKKLKN